MANKSYCSITGKYYTQSQIDARLSKLYREKHEGYEFKICQGCGKKADDNSHTISQKRCKHIHKVSLIWHPDNIEDLCRKCHQKWENGGEDAKDLYCYERCMEFVRIHDEEGYNKRIYL